jgi:dihydroxyacetone kinase-like protein
MKKIINKPENYVNEMLEGLYIAHPDLVTYTGHDLHCLVSAVKKEGKVGIATGGGSGHLPLFLGYVGKECWTVVPSEMYFNLPARSRCLP